MNAHTGHVYWDIGDSKLRLKKVTIGSRGSIAAIGAGDAGAARNADSRSATDRTGSFYLTSGLALAAFLHIDQQKITTRIVDAEQGPISMLKCSASGDMCATVHGQPTSFEILIWRRSAGAPSTRLRLMEDPIDIDFGGADGGLLLVLTRKALLCFNTASGQSWFTHALREAPNVLCFSTQSSFVTGGIHHLATWTVVNSDGSSGRKVHKLPFKLGSHAAHSSFVDIKACKSRCTSMPCTILALASDGKVVEFQHGKTSPDRIVQTRVPHATAFAMLGGNLTVITGGGGMVKVLETERWTTIASLATPPSLRKPGSRHGTASPRNRNDTNVSAVAVVADGPHTVVVQYANSSLCCWDLQDPSKSIVKWELLGHAGAITALCAPTVSYIDGAAVQVYATVCTDGFVRVWQRSTCSKSAAAVQLTVRVENAISLSSPAHDDSLVDAGLPVAAISCAGKMLAIGEPGGSVSFYILPSPTKYRLDVTHDSRVACLAWGTTTSGQCLASGGDDGRVHLHRIHGSRISPLQTIEARSAVTCVAMLDANASQMLTLAVGEQDGTTTFWGQSTDSFHILHEVKLQDFMGCLNPKVACAQAVAAFNCIALMSQDSYLLLVEPKSGKILHSSKQNQNSPTTCMATAGSVIACGHQDGSVSVIDAISGESLAKLKSHSESVSGCLLNADQLELMTTSHNGCTHIWDMCTMADRLQQCTLTLSASPRPNPATLKSNGRPKSGPLQDLQNIISGRVEDEPELAPLPSHLFSPRQASKGSAKRNANAVAASVPLLNNHMLDGLAPDASLSSISGDIGLSENGQQTTLPLRLSRAEREQASGHRMRGSSMSALRHSIAGHPSAEVRRQTLQRQRDHKLWESNHMTMLEQLRTELEACPVRRLLHRKSLTHVEMKAPLPDRLHLNLSSILSPIPKSVSESISTAHTSQCLRSCSLSFRRSFSVPLGSPHTRKQGMESVTHTSSPSGYIACDVDDSFSSLTLPSPTTLARDLCKVGGFIQSSEQDMSAVTPTLTAPAKQELPYDDAVRSDVKRGFAWKANGVYTDAQCISTGPALHADKPDQDTLTASLGPDVQSECRLAPAPTLAKAIQDRGAAVAEDQVGSKIARLPGSRLCDISKKAAFDVSGSVTCVSPCVTSGQVAPIVPQPPHGPSRMQHGVVTAAGSTAAVAGVQEEQDPNHVLCGVEAAAEPPFAVGIAPAVQNIQDHNRACPCSERTCMPLRSTSHPVRCRASSSSSSASPSTQKFCESPELSEHVSPLIDRSGCRRIPRGPNHSRASGAPSDSPDTTIFPLVSVPSQHGAPVHTNSVLCSSMNGPSGLKPCPMGQANTQTLCLGSTPKPRVLQCRGSPGFGTANESSCSPGIGSSPSPVTRFGTGRQVDCSPDANELPVASVAVDAELHRRQDVALIDAPATIASAKNCNPVLRHSTGSGSGSELFLKRDSMLPNHRGVSAAIDAAFSPAFRVEIQQVIQGAVANGWNYQSQELRVSLAAQLSKESDRLAAIAADLCGSGATPSSEGNEDGQCSVSVLFDQLSVLRARVHTCEPTVMGKDGPL